MPKTSRNAKNWCFTEFTLENVVKFKHADISYVIVGKEVCPDTQRDHWQGYCQFKTKKRLTWIKANISATAHWAAARGSDVDNYNYCTKDGNLVLEHGTRKQVSRQGKRNDLLAVKAAIDNGNTELECFEQFFETSCKHYRAFGRYRALKQGKIHRGEPTIHVYYSAESGTGKTRLATYNFPNAFWHMGDNMWWDGYNGERVVVFDEFRSQYKYSALLRLLDRTPLTVETKGGTVPMRADTFVFTTNIHPDVWYPGVPDTSALQRRLREWANVVHFPHAVGVMDEEQNIAPPGTP